MAANKYWPIYVGVFVPLFIAILSVVLVVTIKPKASKPVARGCTDGGGECQHGGTCVSGKCQCPPEWAGDRCEVIAVPPTALQGEKAMCGAKAVTCGSDADCVKCGGTVAWKCTELKGDDNLANLKGQYCLPAKPVDECVTDPGPGKYSETVPGVFMWQGWSDVNTQKWSCACEYPQFYPPALGSGACIKAPELCKYGTWHFPCVGKACDLSDEQQRQLANASPLQHGYCQCDNVKCSTGAECASNQCEGGVCMNQRTGLNPRTGMPECVVDTCAPYGKWVTTGTPPFVYGRCECISGAMDTGYGCVPYEPQPLGPGKCPRNCSKNGACLPDNTCQCNAGWSGEACDTPVCTGGCAGRGECVKPGECTCPRGTVYNASSGECLNLITCTPEPAVDANTGDIVNNSNFSVNGGTGCGTDMAAANELCVRSGWTRAQSLSKCFRAVDCSTHACTDATLCNAEVTGATGPIYQVPSDDETSCRNPSVAAVAARCEATPGGSYSLIYNRGSGTYMCQNTQIAYTLQVLSLRGEEQLGLQGTFCVPFASDAERVAARARDGGGVVATYSITTVEDDTVLAGGVLEVKELVSDATCSGYYYTFGANFLTTQPIMSTGGNTLLALRIFAYPQNRWSCMTGDVLPDLSNCVATYANMPDSTTFQLEPYKPEAGYSPALKPILLPDAARALTQSGDAMTAALPASSVVIPGAVGDNTLVPFPPSVANEPYVQVACTDVYCRSGSDVTASVLIVIAWAYEPTISPTVLGAQCSSTARSNVFIKYDLTKATGQGAPVTLLGAQLQPRVATVGSQAVAYFVDVLPAVVEQTWQYTLNAYVVSGESDTSTTYNTAACRSDPQTIGVVVKPYTNAMCNKLPAPMEKAKPPTAWLKDGMCHWEANNVAAIDYYCAVMEKGGGTTFPYNHLHLADASYNCKELGHSYPTINTQWTADTCNPDHIILPPRYTCGIVYPPVLYKLDLSKYGSEQPGGTSAYVSDVNVLTIKLTADSVSQPFVLNLKHAAAPRLLYPYVLFNFKLAAFQSSSPGNVVVQIKCPEGLGILSGDGLAQRGADTVVLTIPSEALGKQLQCSLVFVHSQVDGGHPAIGSDSNFITLTMAVTGAAEASLLVEQVGYTENKSSPLPANSCIPSAGGEYETEAACGQACGAPKAVRAGQGVGDGEVCKRLDDNGSKYSAQDACQGVVETQSVTCHKWLPFVDGNKQIDDYAAFEDRMRRLAAFYTSVREKGQQLGNEEYLLNPASGTEEDKWKAMYNMYYSCGPYTDKDTYGVTCEDGEDPTCKTLHDVSLSCGKNNKCYSWELSSTSYEAENNPNFTQTRKCFPDTSYLSPLSPCCDCRGAYSITDHVPLCTCLPGEESCNFALKPVPVPPTPGPPSPDGPPQPVDTTYTLTLPPAYSPFYSFKGPGGKSSQYRIFRMGSFALKNYQSVAFSTPSNVRVEIGGGNGTDRLTMMALLLAGDYYPSYTALYPLLPPNCVAFTWVANREATRDNDATLQLDTNSYFCMRPNTTYTLVLVLEFAQGKGTDDTVRLYTPPVVTVSATNNTNVDCSKQYRC